MAKQPPGSSAPAPANITLDPYTICTALGVILIAAATLLAIDELEAGGDYAFWYALTDFVSTAALGVLVLVCARRLGPAPWGDALLRALPALGVAAVVASIAIAIKDASDPFDTVYWDVLNDLVLYIPVAFGGLLYLSAVPRGDRVLGQPSQWGRLVGVLGIAGAFAIAINDATDASRNEFWVFLGTFTAPAGIFLLLTAASLEPQGAPQPAASPNGLPLLNDPRMASWAALGAAAVVIAGTAFGIKTMDEVRDDGFWIFLQITAFHLGLGVAIFVASGARLGEFLTPGQPILRWAAIASIAGAFVAGLKFTADADSDHLWIFLDAAIVTAGPGALALAMYEAYQRLGPLSVVGGSSE